MKPGEAITDRPSKSDTEQMERESRISRSISTWSASRTFVVPGFGNHSCTWALCHFLRNDYGNETLGPAKPVIECRHGLTVRISIDRAQQLYELATKEDR